MKSSQIIKIALGWGGKESTTKKVEHEYNKIREQTYETEDYKN